LNTVTKAIGLVMLILFEWALTIGYAYNVYRFAPDMSDSRNAITTVFIAMVVCCWLLYISLRQLVLLRDIIREHRNRNSKQGFQDE